MQPKRCVFATAIHDANAIIFHVSALPTHVKSWRGHLGEPHMKKLSCILLRDIIRINGRILLSPATQGVLKPVLFHEIGMSGIIGKKERRQLVSLLTPMAEVTWVQGQCRPHE